MSSNVTKEEIRAIQDAVGVSMAKIIYTNTTLSIAFAAIQMFIFCYIAVTFLETPRDQRKGRWPYIAASFLIFSLFSVMAASDAFYIFTLAFRVKDGWEFNSLYWARTLEWCRNLSNAAMIAFVVVADGVLVYRCYLVWNDKWWVCIPTVLAYILSTALSIAQATLGGTAAATYLASGWTISSALVNIFATGSITFRLVRANTKFKEAMPGRSNKSFNNVVTMVVESAAPPAVFGLLFAIFAMYPFKMDSVASANRMFGTYFTFSLLFWGFVALSPQLIIFRVTTGRSFTQNHSATTRTSPPASNPLMFARSEGIESLFVTQYPTEGESGSDESNSISREEEKKAQVPV